MKFFLQIIYLTIITGFSVFSFSSVRAQATEAGTTQKKTGKLTSTFYGTASYYAQKFHGRRTASGDLFDHNKFTAACNALPLGTWLKVINLKNKKWVYVLVNDRLSAKSSRILDLTKAAANKLEYLIQGLTRVKVEVLPADPH